MIVLMVIVWPMEMAIALLNQYLKVSKVGESLPAKLVEKNSDC